MRKFEIICHMIPVTYIMAIESTKSISELLDKINKAPLMSENMMNHEIYLVSKSKFHEKESFETIYDQMKAIHIKSMARIRSLNVFLQYKTKSNDLLMRKYKFFRHYSHILNSFKNILGNYLFNTIYKPQSQNKYSFFKKISEFTSFRNDECEADVKMQNQLDEEIINLNREILNSKSDSNVKTVFSREIDNFFDKYNDFIENTDCIENTDYIENTIRINENSSISDCVNESCILEMNRLFTDEIISLCKKTKRLNGAETNFSELFRKKKIFKLDNPIFNEVENDFNSLYENTYSANQIILEFCSKNTHKSISDTNLKSDLKKLKHKTDFILHLYLKYSKNIIIQNHMLFQICKYISEKQLLF